MAKPRDHKDIILYPVDNLNEVRKAQYILKIARPLPRSKIERFTIVMETVDFGTLMKKSDPDIENRLLLSLMREN